MKPSFTTRAAALMSIALTGVFAANTGSTAVTDASRAKSAKAMLSDIRGLAKAASEHADILEAMDRNAKVQPDSHLAQLNAIKEEINKMGADAAALEAERDYLPSWQKQAVDGVMPALRDAAAKTSDAIGYFNDNRQHLWTAEDTAFAHGIFTDTKQIASTLANFLKYEHVREQESRLATKLPAEN